MVTPTGGFVLEKVCICERIRKAQARALREARAYCRWIPTGSSYAVSVEELEKAADRIERGEE